MCSQTSTGGPRKHSDLFATKQWSSSEDVDLDEEESTNFVRVAKRARSTPDPFRRQPAKTLRCKSMSDRSYTERRKINTIEKANTDRSTELRGSSLEKRMKEWHRSTSTIRTECAAKQYTEMLQDDSLKHLRQSIRVAGSIVQKGTNINQELARQHDLIRKSNNDISVAEYDTDLSNERLRGMSSITWKLMSKIRKGKPKLKVKAFSTVGVLNGEMGLCSVSKVCSPTTIPPARGSAKDTTQQASAKDTKQQQLKSGIEELHTTLDIITVQQMDTAWSLKQQDKELSVFEGKMDRTKTKIERQCQMINNIVSKS